MFNKFDKDRSGSIDHEELELLLADMGISPSHDELLTMIQEVDQSFSGAINFDDFIKLIYNQKVRAASFDEDAYTLDAFVACGGNDDKTGSVQRDMLFKIIKQDFGLGTDMEKLYKSLGTEVEGVIEYEDFRQMLRETPAGK